PITRVHGRAFDDRENVTLYTLAGDVGTVATFAAGDLIDLVKEDDAGLLHAIDRCTRDLVHIDEALLLFLDQVLEGFVDLHLALLRALAEEVGQHVLDVDVHLLDALIGDDFEVRHAALADVDLDGAVVKLAFSQLLAKLLAGALRGI